MRLSAAFARSPAPERSEIKRWIADARDLCDLPDKLATLARYWLDARGARDVLPRAALDPTAVKTILPSLLMFGLEYDGAVLRSVRIRLMGTQLVRVYGRDWTGLTTDQFDRADQVDAHMQRLQEIAARRQPLYWRQWSLADGCEDLFAERLMCPLAGPDGAVTSVLAIIDFPGMEYDPRVREGFGPLLPMARRAIM
ncbi:MAG: PAS domain-containing protein [Alphaproteobacteria bacterium]